MKWSWRLGHIAGIGVYVHATFPLLLAWVALSQLSGGATAPATLRPQEVRRWQLAVDSRY